jgi:uncharacterized lipoprotein YajG
MKTLNKFSILLAALIFLSGCAMTPTQVPLNYHPNKNLVVSAKTNKSISVKLFEDARGEDPNTIVHKTNGYNEETSGSYVAEKPIAEILSESIKESLSNSGYSVSQDFTHTHFILCGKLTDLKIKVLQGMMRSTLQTKIMLNLKLIDSRTSTIRWADIIVGKSSVESNVFYTNEDDWLRNGFRLAVDDLITNLLNDNVFSRSF